MTDVERWAPTGIDLVDRAVATWRPASMVPAQFKDKDGNVKLADLQLAGMWLYALDVPPIPNLPAVYVVHGRVGIMAELQRALVARAGWDLWVVESSAERATVCIRRQGDRDWKPDVTVTMAEAHQAGWTKPAKSGELSNYVKIPDRMLAARACTKAISLYAPGALAGIAAPAARVAQLDEEPSDVDALGEVPAGPEGSRLVAPRSVAPSGATIPEHLREPEVDEDIRAGLLERIAALDEPTTRALAAVCKQLRIPNVRTARFTRAHGALLDRLINETVSGPVPGGDPPPAAGAPPRVAPTGPGVPDDVYDDSPEAVEADWQPASYEDPDDPGRPFS